MLNKTFLISVSDHVLTENIGVFPCLCYKYQKHLYTHSANMLTYFIQFPISPNGISGVIELTALVLRIQPELNSNLGLEVT